MSKQNFSHYDESYQEDSQAESLSEPEAQADSSAEGSEEPMPDSDFEEEEKSSLWTREIKIGLAVVLVLVLVLAAVLVKRFTGAGAAEESKQATAKAEGKSSGSVAGGSQAASAVPKPLGSQAGASSSRSGSSEATPWSPSSWGSGTKQPPLGTQSPPAKSGSSLPTPPSAPKAEEKHSNQAADRWPSSLSPPSNGGAATPSGSTMSPSSPGESVAAGSNPLRAGTGPSSGATITIPQESVGSPSGSVSGPLLVNPPGGPSFPQGKSQENPPGYSRGLSEGAFSPYSPPALGLPPAASAEPPRSSSAGTAGMEKASAVGTAPSPGAMGAGATPSTPPVPTSGLPPASGPIGSFSMPRSYVVQSGETYWSISEKFYGTGTYYQALAEYNRSRVPNPEQLRAGDHLMIPSQEELQRVYPHLCPASAGKEALSANAGGAAALGAGAGPGASAPASPAGGLSLQTSPTPAVVPPAKSYRVYIVQEGDSIYDIARHLLGSPTRWVEIYQLNKEVIGEDIEHLRPGTRLAIPPAEPAGSSSPMSAVPARPLPR